MTGKGTSPELFVTRLRRRTLTHAFERALEDALQKSGGEASSGSTDGSGETDDAAQRFQSALEALAEHPIAGDSGAAPSIAAAYKYDAFEPKAAEAVKAPEPAKPVEAAKAAEAHPDPRRAVADLGIRLSSGLSVHEIKRLRRQFALANHPDRVPARLREAAAEAMAVANARIDLALTQARKR